MIKLGSTVAWESQAQGSTKTKTGTVVLVLTRTNTDHTYDLWLRIRDTFPGHKLMFDSLSIQVGAKEAYLVSVTTTAKAAPKLYKPYPSKLTLVKE